MNRPSWPSEVVVAPSRSPGPRASGCAQAEEDLLAFLLIRTWMLATGRVLRSDVPPSQLSEDELIAFWADDHLVADEADRLTRSIARKARR